MEHNQTENRAAELFRVVSEANSQYQETATSIENAKKKIPADVLGRGCPMGHVAHVYGNAAGAYYAFQALERLMTKAEENPSIKLPEAYLKTVYHDAFKALNHFLAQEDGQQDRLKAWEEQVDFAAMGWQGPKPSETLAAMASQIQSFLDQHPTMQFELTGRQPTALPGGLGGAGRG
jgi:hypothetical protein